MLCSIRRRVSQSTRRETYLSLSGVLCQRIRRIGINGVVTTVAGNGNVGYSGDGGPAMLAEFSGSAAVAVDRAGNLYIADFFNNVIRRVTVDGMITTFAGTGVAWVFRGLAVLPVPRNWPDRMASRSTPKATSTLRTSRMPEFAKSARMGP